MNGHKPIRLASRLVVNPDLVNLTSYLTPLPLRSGLATSLSHGSWMKVSTVHKPIFKAQKASCNTTYFPSKVQCISKQSNRAAAISSSDQDRTHEESNLVCLDHIAKGPSKPVDKTLVTTLNRLLVYACSKHLTINTVQIRSISIQTAVLRCPILCQPELL